MIKSKEELIKDFEALTDTKIDKQTQFTNKQVKEGVIYLKIFSNNKVYIGQSTEFKKRMINHKCTAMKNYTCILYKAMRKYKHETYILWQGDKDKLDEMEMYFIKLYNSYGENGYNMSHGGEGFNRGSLHPFSKNKEYFEKKYTAPSAFKKTCERQGWNFREFKPILCEKNKHGNMIYCWKYIGSNNNDYYVFNNELEYVFKNKITRSNFQKWLENKDWEFYDFDEIDSFEKTNNGNRLFFYKYVGKGKGTKVNTIQIPTKQKREDVCYYETIPVTRRGFERWCKTHSHNLNDFKEVFVKRTKNRSSVYNYIYVGNNNGNTLSIWEKRIKMPPKEQSQRMDYYSKNKVTKQNFKSWLKTKLWNIDDFIEIDSKEKTKSGTKLYFYIPKE